jgi:hypothetical protein
MDECAQLRKPVVGIDHPDFLSSLATLSRWQLEAEALIIYRLITDGYLPSSSTPRLRLSVFSVYEYFLGCISRREAGDAYVNLTSEAEKLN